MSEAAASVVGYVEAATGERLLGWAWAPRAPQTRVAIEAVLGGEVVARAAADQPRDDLAKNGVGDGRHAFALDIPEIFRARASELVVVARTDDATPVTLGAPPAVEPIAERLDRLQRGIEALVGSQRVLHRTLQAALTARPEPAANDAETEPARDELRQQIATLEVFVARLDERLAALMPPSAPARGAPPWALLLAGLATVLSAIALLRAIPG